MTGAGVGIAEKRFVRDPRITARQMDDTTFLADPDGEGIYHLNATGAAVWRLLVEPTSVADAVTLIAQAFPDADRSGIAASVTALIDDLARKRLIAPGG